MSLKRIGCSLLLAAVLAAPVSASTGGGRYHCVWWSQKTVGTDDVAVHYRVHLVYANDRARGVHLKGTWLLYGGGFETHGNWTHWVPRHHMVSFNRDVYWPVGAGRMHHYRQFCGRT